MDGGLGFELHVTGEGLNAGVLDCEKRAAYVAHKFDWRGVPFALGRAKVAARPAFAGLKPSKDRVASLAFVETEPRRHANFRRPVLAEK
jgi:hypothetical protein